jgi:hypothetical protein
MKGVNVVRSIMEFILVQMKMVRVVRACWCFLSIFASTAKMDAQAMGVARMKPVLGFPGALGFFFY